MEIGNLLLEAATLLTIFTCVVYLVLTRHFSFWLRRGVPYLKPKLLFGSFGETALGRLNMGQVLHDAYKNGKGQPFIGLFAFDQPMLLIRDPELVKRVLAADFSIFHNRNFHLDPEADPLICNNLFGLTGKRWKQMRVKLTPTFTSGKMKRMFELVERVGREFVEYIERESKEGEVEVKETTARYTTDVIATVGLGIEGGSLRNPDAPLRTNLRRMMDLDLARSVKSAMAFFAPQITSLFRLTITVPDVNDFVRRTVWETVDYRRKNGVHRNDFLDLLMQIQDRGEVDGPEGKTTSRDIIPNFKLEGDDFVAQVFSFLLAGFETSSTTMTFALYLLSQYPLAQQRLREEVALVREKHDGKITYESISEMTYLNMVVSETLRMFPPLPFLDRCAMQDYKLPDSEVTLPKGTCVAISLLGLHYDPAYWEQPEEFMPERFSDDKKASRPSYTYMPFGDGPRNCIGLRLGLMQTKIGLAYIVSEYDVLPSENTPKTITIDPKRFILSPKGGMPLLFKKINNA